MRPWENYVLRSPHSDISDASWSAAAEHARELIWEREGAEREPGSDEIEAALERIEELAREERNNVEPEEMEVA